MEELRIGNKDLIVNNNVVKTPVIPEKAEELKRNIIVEGEADFTGAVYGNSILIHNGPVTFRKAVFGKEEVNVDSLCNGKVKFTEAVGSGESVSCTTNEVSVFGSDINAKNIILRNCFVGGSLYADEINLDHCVVIGGVFATKTLNANHCIMGTFNSQAVSITGSNYLIYPSAFSVEPISSSSGTSLNDLALADLMDMYKGQAPKKGTGLIPIDIANDKQRTNLKAEDGTILLVNSYSVAGKVLAADMLSFENLNNHFLINAASLSSQLMKKYSVTNEDTGEVVSLELDKISEFFFKILDGDIQINILDDTISFEEMKERMDK